MTDTEIERILRRRPNVPVPPWLHSRLRSQIALESASEAFVIATRPWWRRWVPAWSIGLLMAACMVAIAVQTRELHKIRAERRGLERQFNDFRARMQSASAVPANDFENAAQRIEEAHRLRAEIEQLKQQLIQTQGLAVQNETLRAQIAVARANTVAEDPFAAQKAKAERIQCINNIKRIALAARVWAQDHDHVYPPDFQSMHRELNSPALLTCPSDPNAGVPGKVVSESEGVVRITGDAENRSQSWDNFDPRRVSYDWLAAGHPDNGPHEQVIVRCRMHFNVGYADGSAHQFNAETMEYTTDNGILMVRRKASAPQRQYESPYE